MSACKIAELKTRSIVEVSGSDATHFLQGLITGNVEPLAEGAAIHAGLLTPQGKILFDFFVVGTAQGYLLDCRRELTAELMKRLGFYRLRAKVDISDGSAKLAVFACWDGEPHRVDSVASFIDPRLATLGRRVIVETGADIGATGCDDVGESEYHAHRLANGVPEGGVDYTYGEAFPHEANFDQLGGVDFSKGCFVGQEVVSRMQHRGTARKRLVPVKSTAPLETGTAITAGDTSIGTVASVAGTNALALVRLDRAEKAIAGGQSLQAGSTPVRLVQPPWATFTVPGSGNEAA